MKSISVTTASGSALRLDYDDAIAIEADVDAFAGSIPSLPWTLAAGETIQVGWSMLQLDGGTDGEFVAMEPDWRSMPIEWVPGVTRTLVQLRQQRDVAASFDLAPLFPDIRQALVVAADVVPGRPLFLERDPPPEDRPRDSGWLVGCLESANDAEGPELGLVSLYEFCLTAPHVIPFLALPPGHAVRLPGNGQPQVFQIDGPPLLPSAGSLVDDMIRRGSVRWP